MSTDHWELKMSSKIRRQWMICMITTIIIIRSGIIYVLFHNEHIRFDHSNMVTIGRCFFHVGEFWHFHFKYCLVYPAKDGCQLLWNISLFKRLKIQSEMLIESMVFYISHNEIIISHSLSLSRSFALTLTYMEQLKCKSFALFVNGSLGAH